MLEAIKERDDLGKRLEEFILILERAETRCAATQAERGGRPVQIALATSERRGFTLVSLKMRTQRCQSRNVPATRRERPRAAAFAQPICRLARKPQLLVPADLAGIK